MHPAVAESAVVSSPDPGRGEVVKAFVILKPKARNSVPDTLKEELQAFCKNNAAPYKYPRKIEFVQAGFFPRTTSGKIQRSELRKLEWKERGRAKL
jgi:acyl-coenzyme A synthetase/AMP-(fatty) acid ligase